MPHIVDDLVLEEVTTPPGVGDFALVAALVGHRRFNAARHNITNAAIAVNDTVPYLARVVDTNGVPTGAFELGVGTYTAANTLTRTTVLRSSNADAIVNFTSGTLLVGIVDITRRAVYLDDQFGMPLPNTSTATVRAASTDSVTFFAQKIAGRMTPRYIGPNGVSQILQDKISTSKYCMYLPNNGTAVGLNYGLGWTSGGTVSHPTPSSTAPAAYSQIKRTRWANVGTNANQVLGLRTAATEKIFWRGNAAGLGGWNFHARYLIGLWPASTCRIFVGLTSSTAGLVASDALAGDLCGFWHDTTMAANRLDFVVRDNVTTTTVPITLPAAIAAGQAYDAYIWAEPNGASVFYRLENALTRGVIAEGSVSTNLPRNTIFLGPELAMSNGTANITVTTVAPEVAGFSCQSDS
jgi:hypothetical protein